MTVHLDVQPIEGLSLTYVAGTEAELSELDINQVSAESWWQMLMEFPTATLEPLFTSVSVRRSPTRST